MIKIGTDIVEISRFSQMDNLDLFIKRVFSKREREYIESKGSRAESIAGAFAAKEAFSKFMGSGFRGFGLHDIEVLHDDLGKPCLCFMGKRLDTDVSISHSKTMATAVVCGERVVMDGKRLELLKSYRALLPKRRDDMHKGDCGRVFAVAGSDGMVGAACLCAKSSLRTGSGLVTLGTPKCVQPTAASKLTEVMTLPLECDGGILSAKSAEVITKHAQNSDVCAIGPGLGSGSGILSIITALLAGTTPCVIDADGLNAIAQNPGILKEKNCAAVLTPHPGEMARLCGMTIDKVEQNRETTASRFAREYDVVVVLKGHETVIAAPNGEVHTNTTGNSGMASGGMGDVLTGIIASFIGQGLNPFNAALLSVFIHGLAGDIAAEKLGEFGLIAGDVLETIPYAVKQLADY